jgi:nitric oxide synthase-interacting protein
MTKHSKNNTASSIFSYAERKKLEYGTKGVRSLPCLDITSIESYHLCSNVSVTSPCEGSMRVLYVCSEHGIRWLAKRVTCFAKSVHIRTFVSFLFRKCSFTLCQTRPVAQKKDIKRQKERLEALKKEAEQEKARAKEAARERVLAEFEKGQLGLAAVAAVTTTGTEVQGSSPPISCLSPPLS